MSEIRLKTKEDIEQLKISGKILSRVLKEISSSAEIGVNILSLDDIAKDLINSSGAKAAFYGFKPEGAGSPFPGHICASINNEIVHGIPRDRVIKEGDVIKFDCGVDFNGYITDAAITLSFGVVSDNIKLLIRSTRKALDEALLKCFVGNTLGDIGEVIEKNITEPGFKVIKSLTGHGVGFDIHEPPTVFNYGQKSKGLRLTEGLVLAIEPIASLSSENIRMSDTESFLTDDDSISAHFETSVAITSSKPIILVELPK